MTESFPQPARSHYVLSRALARRVQRHRPASLHEPGRDVARGARGADAGRRRRHLRRRHHGSRGRGRLTARRRGRGAPPRGAARPRRVTRHRPPPRLRRRQLRRRAGPRVPVGVHARGRRRARGLHHGRQRRRLPRLLVRRRRRRPPALHRRLHGAGADPAGDDPRGGRALDPGARHHALAGPRLHRLGPRRRRPRSRRRRLAPALFQRPLELRQLPRGAGRGLRRARRRGADPAEGAEALAAWANAQGGRDNVTVVLIRITR